MSEKIIPFPDKKDPDQKRLDEAMERLRNTIKSDRDQDPNRYNEFVFEEVFNVSHDRKEDKVTVTGPVGVSIHTEPPTGGESLLDHGGQETVEYGPAVKRHFEAVQRLYASGLLEKSDTTPHESPTEQMNLDLDEEPSDSESE